MQARGWAGSPPLCCTVPGPCLRRSCPQGLEVLLRPSPQKWPGSLWALGSEAGSDPTSPGAGHRAGAAMAIMTNIRQQPRGRTCPLAPPQNKLMVNPTPSARLPPHGAQLAGPGCASCGRWVAHPIWDFGETRRVSRTVGVCPWTPTGLPRFLGNHDTCAGHWCGNRLPVPTKGWRQEDLAPGVITGHWAQVPPFGSGGRGGHGGWRGHDKVTRVHARGVSGPWHRPSAGGPCVPERSSHKRKPAKLVAQWLSVDL